MGGGADPFRLIRPTDRHGYFCLLAFLWTGGRIGVRLSLARTRCSPALQDLGLSRGPRVVCSYDDLSDRSNDLELPGEITGRFGNHRGGATGLLLLLEKES